MRAFTAAVAAASLVGSALAGPKCGPGSPCPEDAPCCSQYGDCGVGAFCLGGCDPLFSHSFDSCVPGLQCKSGDFKLNSLNDIEPIDSYLGDGSKTNWQSQGKPVVYQNNALLLTMAEGTVGTLLASTHYVWYGKVCAKMTTSQGKGVVTAFILMSDVKDEIDFEFVGVDIQNAQSNYYSQGVTVYTNERNLTVGNGDTVSKVHEYCIDWSPDELHWLIDGNDMRTVKRSDTWNATSKRFDYPQTPSRIMLSLWPAGLPSNEKGTIDWAGGEIDWNSEYMQNGYYYAMVQEVTVECGDAPPMAQGKGTKSYIYTDAAGTNNTVELSDKVVVLGSLYADGEHPNFGATTASSNAPKPTKSVDTVPGGNPGGGNRNENISTQSASGAQSTSGGNGNPNSPQETASNNNNNNGGGDGFQQGAKGAGAALEPGLGRLGGSGLAIVLAMLGLLVL